jgi:hypothetical protein
LVRATSRHCSNPSSWIRSAVACWTDPRKGR